MVTAEDYEEWPKMIREILVAKELKYGCKLTPWGVSFLESCHKQPVLSDRQGKVIERIYKEKME